MLESRIKNAREALELSHRALQQILPAVGVGAAIELSDLLDASTVMQIALDRFAVRNLGDGTAAGQADPEPETGPWVVRSGSGYLLDTMTGEMIAAGLRDEGALQARRFKTRGAAEHAATRIRERGFHAAVIELQLVKHGGRG
jgi:hypothetical protein